MGRRPVITRLKARANRAKSGSVNPSRRVSARTVVKKHRSERRSRRSFDATIEYGAVAMMAAGKTPTAKSAARSVLLALGDSLKVADCCLGEVSSHLRDNVQATRSSTH